MLDDLVAIQDRAERLPVEADGLPTYWIIATATEGGNFELHPTVASMTELSAVLACAQTMVSSGRYASACVVANISGHIYKARS